MPRLFTKKCPVCEIEITGYGQEHLAKNEEAHMKSHDMAPQEEPAPEPKPELEPGKNVDGTDYEEPAPEPEPEPVEEEKPKKKDRKRKKRG